MYFSNRLRIYMQWLFKIVFGTRNQFRSTNVLCKFQVLLYVRFFKFKPNVKTYFTFYNYKSFLLCKIDPQFKNLKLNFNILSQNLFSFDEHVFNYLLKTSKWPWHVCPSWFVIYSCFAFIGQLTLQCYGPRCPAGKQSPIWTRQISFSVCKMLAWGIRA